MVRGSPARGGEETIVIVTREAAVADSMSAVVARVESTCQAKLSRSGPARLAAAR